MNEEVIEELTLPIGEILGSIITQAKSDNRISEEERKIIEIVKTKMNTYNSEYNKLVEKVKVNNMTSKEWLVGLVEKQSEIFERLLNDVQTEIETDGAVDTEEIEIFKILANKMDEVIERNEEKIQQLKN